MRCFVSINVGRFIFAAVFVAFLLIPFLSRGREVVKFESTVHDFGQILISDGKVNCTFTGRNVSSEPVVIQSVITSCGCTSVKWDHNPIAPGQTTEISASYDNNEGPYAFDKTLTVKISGQKQPVLLHLRGISREKISPDSEVYTFLYGGNVLGFLSDSFKCPNLVQGGSAGDQTTLANLSEKPVKVTFTSVSEGLSLEVVPNPVPARSRATLYYTVSARTDKWGRNVYCAEPVADGRKSGRQLKVQAFTTENFDSISPEAKKKGSRPVFPESTFSFGHQKRGAVLKATFTCENRGASTLVVHKADSDFPGAVPGSFNNVAAGDNGNFSVTLDTSDLPKGEALIIITLTTNSPVRPLVNLFLAGIID